VFVSAGQPSYELCPNGADTGVDANNISQYLEALLDATLGSGVATQLKAFREGFGEVFDLHALDVFREDEIEVLLCGAGETWTPSQLAESIKFDHGYTAQSTPIR
jgi:E3 ubiquitin-protein ligase TRIP12